jgi:tetratricopeptide (TPR) repeat protein
VRLCLAIALNRYADCLATVLERERAAEMLGEAVELGRASAKRAAGGPEQEQANAYLAVSLHHLAQQLAEVTRYYEALAAVTEAVGIRRRLTPPTPEVFALPLELSLRLQSELLSKLDRAEEALSVAQEAVMILREPGLTDDKMAATHLAGALDRVAICLAA